MNSKKQDNIDVIDLELINNINDLLCDVNENNRDAVLLKILEIVGAITKADSTYLFLKDESKQEIYFHLCGIWYNPKEHRNIIIKDYLNSQDKYFISIYKSLLNNELFESINLPEGSQSRFYVFSEEPISLHVTPIIISNQLIGFLGFNNSLTFGKCSEINKCLLTNLFKNIGLTYSRLNQNQKLKDLEHKVHSSISAQSEFLSNISHEIRTPMNAIIGFAELLRNSKKINIVQQQYLDGISRSSQNLLELINDILDLSKIESGKLVINYECSDVRNILKDIHNIFYKKAEVKGIRFNIHVDDTIPNSLMIDELRLRQVLFNLVGNALKFTHSGFVEIFASMNGGSSPDEIDLIFKIRDTGIGIQENKLSEIFEAFKQIDGGKERKFEGTGLGLTIAKKLANLMNGTLSAESIYGAGSTFTLIFSNIKGSNGNTCQANSNDTFLQTIKFQPSTIILAEDVLTFRQLIKMYLRNHNFNIIEAINGKEAVQAAQDSSPDLILMDLQMPLMNGFEAAKKIKQQMPNIPIIAISSETEDFNLPLNKELFSSYIQKPISKIALLSEISKYLIPFSDCKDEEDCYSSENDNEIRIQIGEITEEFIRQLDRNILPQYEAIRKTLYVSRIKQFVGFLKEIAEEHNINIISNYADELANSTNEYQIDKIAQIMARFQNIIEAIHNANNNK